MATSVRMGTVVRRVVPAHLACRARPPPGQLLPQGRLAEVDVSFTLIGPGQLVRLALAQFTREFTHTPGTLPAALVALRPRQAALEETFMEVTGTLQAAGRQQRTGSSPPRRSW